MGVERSKTPPPRKQRITLRLTRTLVFAFGTTPGKTETGPSIYSIGQARLVFHTASLFSLSYLPYVVALSLEKRILSILRLLWRIRCGGPWAIPNPQTSYDST